MRLHSLLSVSKAWPSGSLRPGGPRAGPAPADVQDQEGGELHADQSCVADDEHAHPEWGHVAAHKVHVHGDEAGEEQGARTDEYEELLTQ